MALFGSDNFRPRTTAEIFGTTVYHEEDPLPTNVAALPADVAALQSIINTLQAELKATTSVNTHLAASVARLQAEKSNHTSTDTALNTPTTTTTAPLPFPHPGNTGATIACGRGAASPEVFQQIIKSNWHGRLGRTHMVDVDALPPAALMELDSLLRRKLQCIFPHGAVCTHVDADNIFACLAVLGLRMEDRARYVDNRILGDDTICHDSTTKRARLLSAHFHANLTMQNYGYWRGLALETLVELARYRGLFDDEGYLKVE